MIGAMPIASASTAWAQNAEGNIALSLALVLSSTVLTLVVLPVLYDWVEGRWERRRQRGRTPRNDVPLPVSK